MSGVEAEEDILVSCGGVQGKLIMQEFICPGIHQRCIEVDGVLMTPKAFCVIGDKQRLKDWKNAIRINGKSIRRRMYARDIDFYKHDEICTGRCMSRNYGPSKYDLKIDNLRQSNPDDSSNEWPSLLPVHDSADDSAYNFLREVTLDSPGDSNHNEHKPGPAVFPSQQVLDGSMPILTQEFIKEEVASDEEFNHDAGTEHSMANSVIKMSGSSNGNHSDTTGSKHRRKITNPQRVSTALSSPQYISANIPPDTVPLLYTSPTDISTGATPPRSRKGRKNGTVTTEQESKIMKIVAEFPDTDSLFEDSVTFWQGVRDVGILDSVIRDIKLGLDNIKNDIYRQGVQQIEADKMSCMVKELGLVTKLKWRLAEHKASAESEKDQLLKEIQALKMKVAQSEQKQLELKRKAECFDNLLDSSVQPHKHKRERLAYGTESTTNKQPLQPEDAKASSPDSSMSDASEPYDET